MKILKLSLILGIFMLGLDLFAQDTTHVVLKLELIGNERLSVNVYPPSESNSWTYVVPEIIPGTYMKINYERFYDRITAIDSKGQKMKVKKKDNIYSISGDAPLDYLSFTVKQSLGDGKVWDNILACAGTIFTDDSYLINFELISGYFDGYQSKPFKITVDKVKDFYGATSMQSQLRSNGKDVFEASTYDEVIDQPILYAQADTCSFKIRDQRFKISVHSETGMIKAEMLKPRLSKIMHAIDTFSGLTREEDYHFVFYYVDKDRLKGMFKTFGMGSALEHNQSSFYYFNEAIYDSTFSGLDWIASHEYFHTITPLSLHSEKIHNFNFEQPDMSRHGWMYEGVTDYFAALLSAQHDLSNSFANNMAWAMETAERQKARSFTESSQNIIKKNMFSWLGKIGQLGNFYERGKVVAFMMDMELFERSNGERRLIDVMLEMDHDLKGSYFQDDQLDELLVKYTFPEMQEIYDRYIEGEEIVPYEKYFERLGWKYYPAGSSVPGYGSFNIFYNTEQKNFYVNWQKSNDLNLKRGDIVKSINGKELNESEDFDREMFYEVYRPENGDNIRMTILRGSDEIELSAIAKPQKIKYPRMVVNQEFTEEQKAFREEFYKKGSE